MPANLPAIPGQVPDVQATLVVFVALYVSYDAVPLNAAMQWSAFGRAIAAILIPDGRSLRAWKQKSAEARGSQETRKHC